VLVNWFNNVSIGLSQNTIGRMHSIGGAGVKCEVRGGKMRGTGARYQCEATGNLWGWNVRGATDNWRSEGVVI